MRLSPWLLMLGCAEPFVGAVPLETSTTQSQGRRVVSDGAALWTLDDAGVVYRGETRVAQVAGSVTAAVAAGESLFACDEERGLVEVTPAGVQVRLAHVLGDGGPREAMDLRKAEASLSLDHGLHGNDATISLTCRGLGVSADGRRVYVATPTSLWQVALDEGRLVRVASGLEDVAGLVLDLEPGGLHERSVLVAEGRRLTRVELFGGAMETAATLERAPSDLTRDPQGRLWALLPAPSSPLDMLGMGGADVVAAYDWRGAKRLWAGALSQDASSVAVTQEALWLGGSVVHRGARPNL